MSTKNLSKEKNHGKMQIYPITISFPDGSKIETGSPVNQNRNAEFNFGAHPAWKDGRVDVSSLRSSAANEMSQIFGGLSDLFKKN